MKKVYKRLLSVLLALVMVVGMIPVSAVSTNAATDGTKTIYFDTSAYNSGAGWGSAYIYMFADGVTAVEKRMSPVTGKNGVFSYDVPTTYTTIIFKPNSGSDWSGQTDNQTIPTDNDMFVCTSFGDKTQGEWKTHSSTSTVEYFNVNATLIDYYNDNRANESDRHTDYNDNQGLWTGSTNKPYSELNSWISGLTGYTNNGISDNSDANAPVPLYFGDLLTQVQDLTWYWKGANVAFGPNYDTANNVSAQGIVGSHLVNGSLVTSYTYNGTASKVPFFEYDTTAFPNQDKYMKFYTNLKFPFTATTTNGVTVYSFDSEKNTVYYDYANNVIVRNDSLEIHDWSAQSGSDVHGAQGNRGYFPFNSSDTKDYINFGFGTKFEIPFTLNTDGKDKNGDAVKFQFTGDDDVWVYIDGALVLDMGGAHNKASGEINFATQKATVTTLGANAKQDNVESSGSGRANDDGSTSVVSFADITVMLSDGTTKNLATYMKEKGTVHTLTMYYMERGMWNSNMSISFTFQPVPSGLILSKEVNTANVNNGLAEEVKTKDYFDFTVTANGSAASEISYKKEYDGEGTQNAKTTTAGVVEDLADNIYAYDFKDSSGDAAFKLGTAMTVTESGFDKTKYTTSWYVWDQKTNSAVAREDSTNSDDNYTATFSLGEASDNPLAPGVDYVVNFVNTPIVDSVSLTKTWNGSDDTAPDEKFKFTVLVDLDGDGTAYDYQPYALDYTINGTSGTTGTDGTLKLAAGETAVFAGIPVGAKVKATETTTSGDGWVVDGDAEKAVTVENGKTNNIEIVNKASTGSVSLTKAWSTGTAPTGTTYEFQILVDQDGDGTAHDYAASALTYTSDNATTDTSDDETGTLSSDGKVQLKAGETITFTGLKVGSKVKATETSASGTGWEVDGVSSKVVTVTAGTTQNITIKNKSIINKVIYIEAREKSTASPDAGTTYTVKDSSDTDGDNKVTVTTFKTTDLPSGTTATPNEEDGSVTYKTSDAGDTGITVSVNDDGSIVFKTENAGKQYVIPYTGTKDNTTVNGEITVFTYKATQKVYVFDYGLKSDLTATNDNKDGLFEGGVFYNTNTTGDNTTTATFSGVRGVDNSQTTIAAASGVTVKINEDGSSEGSVFFTPVAFMDTAENYKYTANIVKRGASFDSADPDPETGTVVNGTIKVMPASVVYYEDNFGAIDTSESATDNLIVNNTAINLTQSNDQSELYGYDDAYKTGDKDSANGSTGMKVGAKASFTFKGTGFDLIARTSDTSGAIVYKVKDTVKDEVKYYGAVDTYYNNGTLYQLPVLSVKNMDYSTYEVTILVIQNSVSEETMTFYLDGVRIYDPAGDNLNSNYIVEEAGADIKDIRQMILGNCEITENGVVDPMGEIITSAKVENSTASVLYYSDPDLYFYGFMNQEDMGDTEATYAASLAEYLRRGPANEVYLSGDAGVAFVVRADDAANPTFQVEAKAVTLGATDDRSDLNLQMVADDGTLKKVSTISTISTNTAMYYDINVTDGIDLENGYYLVVLVGDASATECISLTNLKTKGYEISSPTDSSNETRVEGVIEKVTPDFGDDEDLPYSVEVTFVKYENTLAKGREAKAIVSVPEGSEIAGFQVYGNGNSLTTRTVKLTTADGKTQYRVAFMMPSTKGTYTLKFVPYKLDTDGVTHVDSAAYMSKTATLR